MMAQGYVDVPLTPKQRGIVPPAAPEPSLPTKAKEAVNDAAIGAVKGLATSTSNAVGLIPGVTKATNAIGNAIGGAIGEKLYGTKANPVSVASGQESLKATNTAQSIGKGIEQVAEFFVPAGPARQALKLGLVSKVPASVWPHVSTALEMIAEAASAGGVSAAQGNEHPERAAAIAGAGPLIGEAGKASAAVLKSQLGRELTATLSAVGAAHLLGDISIVSLGAGWGVYHMAKTAAEKIVNHPEIVSKLQQAAYTGSKGAARLLAGAYSAMSNSEAESK